MPPRRKHRHCRFLAGQRVFKPPRVPMSELALYTVGIDEFEAMRLCDHDGLSQIEAAERMKISRGTVQRLLERGRWTILEAVLDNGAVSIARAPVEEADRQTRPGTDTEELAE